MQTVNQLVKTAEPNSCTNFTFIKCNSRYLRIKYMKFKMPQIYSITPSFFQFRSFLSNQQNKVFITRLRKFFELKYKTNIYMPHRKYSIPSIQKNKVSVSITWYNLIQMQGLWLEPKAIQYKSK